MLPILLPYLRTFIHLMYHWFTAFTFLPHIILSYNLQIVFNNSAFNYEYVQLNSRSCSPRLNVRFVGLVAAALRTSTKLSQVSTRMGDHSPVYHLGI